MPQYRRRLAVVFIPLLASCSASLTIPDDASIQCASDSECPLGRHCIAAQCAPDSSPCVSNQGGTFVAANDGNKCNLGGIDGVCISGQCTTGRCGDGFVAGNEVCDDGNTVSGDGCRGDCMKVEVCGDGVVDAGEACDDGNTKSGDGCRGDCKKIELCGDAIVDANETCDDANSNPNDGCDTCSLTTWVATPRLGVGSTDPTQTAFTIPDSVVADVGGNIFVSDNSSRVYRIDAATGHITIAAGNGQFGFSGDGGPAAEAQLHGPTGLAIDSRGVLYIADEGNHRIRRVDPTTSVITTIAGSGISCFTPTAPCASAGDGSVGITATLIDPVSLALGDGALFIADQNAARVRRLDLSTNIITTVVGDGTMCSGTCGDGGAASAAEVNLPRGLAFVDGKLYIADWGALRVRVVDTGTGTIATLMGTGSDCNPGTAACGDGGPASLAQTSGATALAYDGNGGLLLGEGYSFRGTPGTDAVQRLRRIDLTAAPPSIATIAGSGATCTNGATGCGDGSSALAASFNSLSGIAVTPHAFIVIDQLNNRLRRIDRSTNVVTAFAGSGQPGNTGDGGAATAAILQMPRNVAVDNNGNIFFVDQQTFTVRRIDAASGIVTNVAGGNQCAYPPCNNDGIAATSAQLTFPDGVAVDGSGTIYIGDIVAHHIYRVDSSGTMTVLAGNGTACNDGDVDCGDGGPASAAHIGTAFGLLVHNNALWVADRVRVRRIDLTVSPPTITTAVGTGTSCAQAPCDEGLAPTATRLVSADAVAFDSAGNLFVADSNVVFKVDLPNASPTATRFAGTGTPCSSDACNADGNPLNAQLSGRGMTIDANDDVYVSDYSPGHIRRIHYDASAAAYTITTVAGTASATYSGDGGAPASASMSGVEGLAMRGTTIIVAENAPRIRAVDLAGNRITSLAGVDPLGDGPFAHAQLSTPLAVTSVTPDVWLIADGQSQRLRRANTSSGTLDTVAGYSSGTPITNTAQPARYADQLGHPAGVAYDGRQGHSTLYISEAATHSILQMTMPSPSDASTWTIATFAGVRGTAGVPSGASEALPSHFTEPQGLAFASDTATLYVADSGNHLIRAIEVDTGVTTVIAGTVATPGYFGDGGNANAALLDSPAAVAVTPASPQDLVYIADTNNNRVRTVDLTSGVIDTIIGDGTAASGGIGQPARVFPIDAPRGIAIDAFGNVFVAASSVVRLIIADTSGHGSGDSAVDLVYGLPPRTSFPESVTQCLNGIAVNAAADTAVIVDACLGALIEVKRQHVTN